MKIYWLPSETAIEFDFRRHLSNARLALYWKTPEAELMVLFPVRGEERNFRLAVTVLPRQLGGSPIYAGIADLTSQSSIDWRSYHYDFTTPPEIQQKMRQALFGI